MQITWYGHSAFRLDFAGQAVLVDPFFTGNPAFVSDKAAAGKGVKHIVLTHGHADHVGDALDIARTNGATVTTNYDLGMWLVSTGLQNLSPMNTGGTTDLGGFTVSLVRADHSSGEMVDGASVYLGNPCGAIVKAPGERCLSHGRHRYFLRHGADCRNLRAAHCFCADRRSLHDGGRDGGDGDQTLLQTRRRDPLPLRLISDHRCHRGQIRRRHAVVVPDKGKAVAL